MLAKARKAYRLSDPARIEQLTDEICAIDELFARLADIDQRFTIELPKEIGDQFAQHQSVEGPEHQPRARLEEPSRKRRDDQPGGGNAASGHQSILGDFVSRSPVQKWQGRPDSRSVHRPRRQDVRLTVQASRPVPPHTLPPDGLLVASEAVPSQPQLPTTPSSANQSQGDERTRQGKHTAPTA